MTNNKVCTQELNDIIQEYNPYMDLNIVAQTKQVQQQMDDMLTRLEEVSSVIQIAKAKNVDCENILTQDMKKYRLELVGLSKKIKSLDSLMMTLNENTALLEKQLDRAEQDFGISNESKIKAMFSPFFNKNKDVSNKTIDTPTLQKPESVLTYFNSSTT